MKDYDSMALSKYAFAVPLAVLVALPFGCASSDEPATPASDDVTESVGSNATPSGWEATGAPNSAFKTIAGATGQDVLLVYGGCGAKLDATAAFAQALGTESLVAKGVKYIYAIGWQGNCGYDGNFKNSVLGPHVLSRATNAKRVLVVAHSSGAYVAHEWLSQAWGLSGSKWDPSRSLVNKITYFCLDGGGDGNLTALQRATPALNVFFVGARSKTTGVTSRNYATMKALGGTTRFLEVDANGSGCTKSNCMHDSLITTLPHNRSSFVDATGASWPLYCDYASFRTSQLATCKSHDDQPGRASDSRRAVVSYFDASGIFR